MEELTSRTNPAVKEYVKLRDSRSYRYQMGCFVLESHKLVQEALDSDVLVETVWMTAKAMEKFPKLLKSILEKKIPVVQISKEIEQKCTLTGNAGGVFARCGGLKIIDKNQEVTKIGHDGKYLFLVDLQDTGNVGTILRTALALGVDGVIVSATTCDLYSLKVLRASMGCLFRLPIYRSSAPAEDLKNLSRHFVTYAAVVDDQAMPVGSFSFAANSIVVIGNEGNGLPKEVCSACTHRITIPMEGRAESLNASMAAGLLMWEQMKKI